MPTEPLHPPTTRPLGPGEAPLGHCQRCGYDLRGLNVSEFCPECGQPVLGLCRGCGYDLAGLPVEGKCLECAKPIMDSLRGDLLEFSDPAYIATLHKGVAIILASILFFVGTFVVAIAMQIALMALGGTTRDPMADFLPWITTALSVVGAGLSIYGWYLFSAPDPGVYLLDRGDRPRRVLRTVVLINAALTLLAQGFQLSGPTAGAPGAAPNFTSFIVLAAMVLGIASMVLWVIQFFSAMKYLHWLANRIPSPKHAKTAVRYMWLLPVFYVPGIVLCGLGPLIALILYYNFLNEFRKALKKVMGWQRDSLTPAPA